MLEWEVIRWFPLEDFHHVQTYADFWKQCLAPRSSQSSQEVLLLLPALPQTATAAVKAVDTRRHTAPNASSRCSCARSHRHPVATPLPQEGGQAAKHAPQRPRQRIGVQQTIQWLPVPTLTCWSCNWDEPGLLPERCYPAQDRVWQAQLKLDVKAAAAAPGDSPSSGRHWRASRPLLKLALGWPSPSLGSSWAASAPRQPPHLCLIKAASTAWLPVGSTGMQAAASRNG